MSHALSNTTNVARRYLSLVLIAGLLMVPHPFSFAQTVPETEDIADEQVTLVETGTAAATDELYNFSNTNDVQTNASSTEDTTLTETSTPTSSAGTSTQPAIVEIENQATNATAATTSAATGNNEVITAPNNTAIVSSGDAYAYTNVVNLTNTNIINSEGFILFLNQLFGTSDIDFRSMFDVFSGSGANSSVCTESNCEANGLETYISNQTSIDNNITVSATTGNNAATGGTAAVLTGDAYAAANVTNIANTNIVDANYLVMTFSNFGDLLGNIILPSKSLLQTLFQNAPSVQTESLITNEANIENQLVATANTGDNTSTGSSSTIVSGDANAYTNVYNQTNTNAINNDSFTILFRIHGNWNGSVFGLPDGLSYEQTAAGISISNNTSESTLAAKNISATITNEANIANYVSVEATTGNNAAYGNELGYVDTGNAYAAANVTNIANTNILGRNWSLLIFDIFGDWQGDLSFGQPDIWIGGTASARNGTTGAGSEIVYTFTASNLGDATASNVRLNGSFNSDLITLDTPITNIALGSIAPGETVEKTFVAKVADSLPAGSFPVDLEAVLTSSEPDANLDNNREVVTVIAENIARGGSSRNNSLRSRSTDAADLLITKAASVDQIEPGETVGYEITLTNSGGPIYDAILYDTLYDSTGAIMLDQNWPLYTIETDETITINYDVAFATSTERGSYFNRAQVLGYDQNTNPKYMQPYDSMIATVPLIVGNPTPEVLGAAITNECTPYLDTFMNYNQTNDQEEVRRLQTFLQEYESSPVPISGFFDESTLAAVKDFQTQYRDTVLAPWGLTEPTGYVYYTTQKTINELHCDNIRAFPLTLAQAEEIRRYKNSRRIPPPQGSAPVVIEQPIVEIVEPEPVVIPPVIIDTPAFEYEQPVSIPTPEVGTSSRVRSMLFGLIQNGAQNVSRLKFW